MAEEIFDQDILRRVGLEGVIEESPSVRTLVFRDGFCQDARSGQFVMIWFPGVDELPMSLSLPYPRGRSSITVRGWGAATESISKMTKGDGLWLRGPYGRGFEWGRGRALLVGGGTGLAPILHLAHFLKKDKVPLRLVLGARRAGEAILIKHAEEIAGSEGLLVCTDDGSMGLKGSAVDGVMAALVQDDFQAIYACGPERMMVRLLHIAIERNIGFQACLERPMRCAVGLCGSCNLSDRLVCRDGPVFAREDLESMLDEFGKKTRDEAGRLVQM